VKDHPAPPEPIDPVVSLIFHQVLGDIQIEPDTVTRKEWAFVAHFGAP
jgi:hypothetical protein